MNLRRAIGASAAVYVATFIVGLAVLFIVGTPAATEDVVPPLMWITSAVTAVLFSAVGAWWYFRSPAVPASGGEGLKFGGVAIATGFVFDMLLALPTLIQGRELFIELLSFYLKPVFWVTLLLILVVPAGVGYWLARSSRPDNSPLPPAQTT